jgi:MFS family permease
MTNQPPVRILKVVSVASVGGGLEMYDFVIYAFFAPIIGKLFFPQGNDFIATLSAFVVFAIGYYIRPLGAFVFGQFGDTVGRKKTLLITIVLMAVSTTLVGLLPTYQSIGITATMLLVFLRLLQGFAVGGDLPSAITFVAEHVPASRRGFHCSWIYTGVNLGITFAAIVSTIITSRLSEAEVQSFGWRIGFLIGLGLAGMGFYLRTQLEETPAFSQLLASRQTLRFPIINVFKSELPAFFKALGVTCLSAVVVGQMLFMTTYLHQVAKLSLQKALLWNTLGILLWSVLMLVMGYCSDRLGRKFVIRFSAITLIVFSYPLYHWIASGEMPWIISGLIGFAILMSGIIGAFPSLLSELFPATVRNSGIGIAYNLGFALFCSSTPLIMLTLVHQLGPAAPSYWVILAALITFLTTLTFAETVNKPLF